MPALLPPAAVLNWVLKDGLGRLGKLAVTAYYGDRIDADVKRFRCAPLILSPTAIAVLSLSREMKTLRCSFASSIVYNLSHALEIITPAFPSRFLMLATLANIGKSIGITTGALNHHVASDSPFLTVIIPSTILLPLSGAGNVCRAPIQMTFARNNNIGEIAARTSAQQVLADNLGLALSVSLMWACRNRAVLQRTLPFIMYPFLALIDLGGIHKELEHVNLRSLNKERAEMLTMSWLRSREVLTPAEVAKKENFLLPEPFHAANLPLKLMSLHEVVPNVEQLHLLLGLYKSKREVSGRYVLQSTQRGQTLAQRIANSIQNIVQPSRNGYSGHLKLAVELDAPSESILVAMLQAEHLRHWQVKSRSVPPSDESMRCEELMADPSGTEAIERSLAIASNDVTNFRRALQEKGWDVDSVYIDGPQAPKYKFGAAA
jgi:glutamate N-acetyltransferase/amino-acid N-acetyltransferase